MTWFYESEEVVAIPEEYAGFVYLITNNLTGKKYIGKKLSKFSRTTYKMIGLKNGKKRRKKIRAKIESDWQTYYGSSASLNRDVEQLGTENFRREILYYCRSKAECSYLEAREQFARCVLESDEWYNEYIQVRVHGSHIKSKML
jgi:hypothetical protein